MIIQADGRRLEISNAGKVLFPADGITEGDLAKYYASVAEAMLPHVRGRPIMMQRFPRGIREQPIIQQRAPEHLPSWIKRAKVKRVGGGSITHAVIGNAATLVYLADQACITPHVWLSRADKPERPDQMIFDLDLPAGKFELARAAARALREVLEELGLGSFVKTTGGNPERFTIEQRKTKRRGRLYLDVIRNAYGQTAVAPYAVRARAGAPVATPLAWEELDDRELSPEQFTLKTVPRRLKRRRDPWREMARRAYALGPARRRLNRLLKDL